MIRKILFIIVLAGLLVCYTNIRNSKARQSDVAKRKGVVVFVLDSEFEAGTGHGYTAETQIKKVCSRASIKKILLKKGRFEGTIDNESYLLTLTDILEYVEQNTQITVVISINFGGYSSSILESFLISELLDKGAVIVASAGNDNKNEPFYPAAYDGVIAVASVTAATLVKTDYSNFGEFIDIAARGFTAFDSSEYHGFKTGTSFAGPIVAGVIAEILAVNHSLSVSEAEDIIKDTAKPIDDKYYYNGHLGAGLLNPTAALQKASPNSLFNLKIFFYEHKAIVGVGGLILVCLILIILFGGGKPTPYRYNCF